MRDESNGEDDAPEEDGFASDMMEIKVQIKGLAKIAKDLYKQYFELKHGHKKVRELRRYG